MCLSYLICKIEVLTQAICNKIYKVLNSFPETQDLPSVSDSFYINTVFDKKVFGCCLVKDPPIISVWDPNSCPWDRGVWTWNLWTAGPAQASGSLVRGVYTQMSHWPFGKEIQSSEALVPNDSGIFQSLSLLWGEVREDGVSSTFFVSFLNKLLRISGTGLMPIAFTFI